MRTSSVVDDRPIFSAICLRFLSLVHSFLHFYLARSQSLVILEERMRVLCSHIIFLMIFLFMHLMGIPFSPPFPILFTMSVFFFSHVFNGHLAQYVSIHFIFIKFYLRDCICSRFGCILFSNISNEPKNSFVSFSAPLKFIK